MRDLNARQPFFFLLAFIFMGLEAQNALPVAGGDATGSGGTVSYTIGQVWYTVIDNNDATVFQGIQQPFEILRITGIHSYPGITLNAAMYPNPAVDFINLKVEDQHLKGLAYQLFNLEGERLEQKDITADETRINMTHLGSATYLIRITRDDENIKAFKIIKY